MNPVKMLKDGAEAEVEKLDVSSGDLQAVVSNDANKLREGGILQRLSTGEQRLLDGGGALVSQDLTQFRLILKLLGVSPHARRQHVVPYFVAMLKGENSTQGGAGVGKVEQPEGFELRADMV